MLVPMKKKSHLSDSEYTQCYVNCINLSTALTHSIAL